MKTYQYILFAVAISMFLAGGPVLAQDEGMDGEEGQEQEQDQVENEDEDQVELSTSDIDTSGWGFGLAPRVGLLIPTSKLKPFVVAALEFDVFFPVLNQRLVAAADFSFTWPRTSGSGTDPRIGGDYDYDVDVLQFKWAVDVLYRFLDNTHDWVPFAGIGGAAQYLKTSQTTSFDDGTNTEKNVEFGFEVLGGLDYRLGPGFLFADVRFVFTDFDQRFAGDINGGAFTLAFGYRFVF